MGVKIRSDKGEEEKVRMVMKGEKSHEAIA